MAEFKVLIVYPNPRKMSLVYGAIASFSALLKNVGVSVDLFDTSLYENQGYIDSDENMEKYLYQKPAMHKFKQIVQMEEEDVFSAFSSKVNSYQPDLLAVTCVESTFEYAISLLRTVNGRKIPTILGGVFATFSPAFALSYEEIDLVCVGEGEKALVNLVQKMKNGLDYSTAEGLYIKNKGQIIKNRVSYPVSLDEIPLGDFTIFNEKRFYRAMAGKIYKMAPIETHRGCSQICTFCNSPLQNKMYKDQVDAKYFRAKPIKDVYKEIKYFVDKFNVDYLFFWADNFFMYPLETIEEFCAMYEEFKLPFYCQSYPTTINERKLKLLKNIGLHRLGVGIEHGNEEFRKKVIKRSYTNASAKETLSLLKKYDVKFSANNIIGFPDETPELVMDTVELNRAIDADVSSCSVFTPFRGTPLRELVVEKGYLKDPDILAPSNSEDSILDMPQFTKKQIEGKRRAFELYIKFPKKRWKEISIVENLTPEADKLWGELRQEFLEKYCADNDM